jgi:hypothetical protein
MAYSSGFERGLGYGRAIAEPFVKAKAESEAYGQRLRDILSQQRARSEDIGQYRSMWEASTWMTNEQSRRQYIIDKTTQKSYVDATGKTQAIPPEMDMNAAEASAVKLFGPRTPMPEMLMNVLGAPPALGANRRVTDQPTPTTTQPAPAAQPTVSAPQPKQPSTWWREAVSPLAMIAEEIVPEIPGQVAKMFVPRKLPAWQGTPKLSEVNTLAKLRQHLTTARKKYKAPSGSQFETEPRIYRYTREQ